MEYNFINDTGETAYIQLGLGTFDVNYGNSGTFDGTQLGGGSAIAIGTIAPGGTLTNVDITEAISAKLLLSLGTTLVSDAPTFTNPGVADSNVRWDKVELSLFQPTDTADASVLNLSAADFYGLDLQVQTFASADAIAPAQTLGSSIDALQMMQSLAAVANYSTFAVMTGADGVPVTGPGGETIDVIRVVAPSSIAAAATGDLYPYPSFQGYIDSFQNSGSVITVQDQFDGNTKQTGSQYLAQTFDFTATIAANGDLVMTGTAGAITGTKTIEIVGTDLVAGIYSANPPFTVDGSPETVSTNDVYAAAVRDVLAGFDSGFVNSTEINPNTPGTNYANSSTGSWYNPAPGGDVAFQNAQTANPTFYDQYAAVIVQNSDSYGSPFSDLIAKPQVQINPGTLAALGQHVDHVDITILPDSIACFATGTPIKTEAGDVPVEHLTVGDRVQTRFGNTMAAVIWIGQRMVECQRHPRPEAVWPVRIRRHAFGPNMPHRDVLLSPDHAVLAKDVLIPIRYLINGTTVVQEQVDRVGYWHVELDRHDVILAAGLPAETFLDTGNRSAFSNGGLVIDAHPEFSRWIRDGEGCAPLVIAGDEVERVRAMLEARARQRRVTSGAGRHRST
jgi:hypothetical protein